MYAFSKTTDRTLDFHLKYYYAIGILPKLQHNSERNTFRTCAISALLASGTAFVVVMKEYRSFIASGAFKVLNHLANVTMAALIVYAIMQFGVCKFEETKRLVHILKELTSAMPETEKLYNYIAFVAVYFVGLTISTIISDLLWKAHGMPFNFVEIALFDHILIAYVQMLVMFMWYVWNVMCRALRHLNANMDKGEVTLLDVDTFLARHSRIAECVGLANDIFGGIFFLITLEEVMHILNTLYFDIHMDRDAFYQFHYLFLMWTSVTVIQGVIVAVMCEKVVAEGRNTITVSYKVLYRYLNIPTMREKLFVLTQQANARCPRFSAAGFFNVDFAMLFTLVNLITTYVIVIIQFSNNSDKA